MRPSSQVVWEFPCFSQEFEKGPEVLLTDEGARLRYDFYTDAGEHSWGEVLFRRVLAFRYVSYDSISDEELLDAYDRVVAVQDSEWLRQVYPRRPWDGLELKHYRMFFDSNGCYECVAESFEPTPKALETRKV